MLRFIFDVVPFPLYLITLSSLPHISIFIIGKDPLHRNVMLHVVKLILMEDCSSYVVPRWSSVW